MTQDHIEIKISGRKFHIKLNNFTPEAKDEIIQTFDQKDFELTELLKAHLGKIQDYANLNQNLKSLLAKLSECTTIK
ncbi:hypothetical protein BKH46_07100 [Helicobacter sp. 12S02634-8]|uniref:hypothetical protein n=1 Tax=Helicobacter sp. 12S02634-8 TaxID=1476199 RepID=UPI000BA5AF0D|nr:hypothetical protein [Helicobacter sp. 12S02634-8]PAF46503.1 hypothetical protein BKH46_07100 [Helicobacter sp. 12S02634-8]